jgi:hypothetical protein
MKINFLEVINNKYWPLRVKQLHHCVCLIRNKDMHTPYPMWKNVIGGLQSITYFSDYCTKAHNNVDSTLLWDNHSSHMALKWIK